MVDDGKRTTDDGRQVSRPTWFRERVNLDPASGWLRPSWRGLWRYLDGSQAAAAGPDHDGSERGGGAHPQAGTDKGAFMCWRCQHHAVSSWAAPPADGVPLPPCSRTVEQERHPALPQPSAGGLRDGAARGCPGRPQCASAALVSSGCGIPAAGHRRAALPDPEASPDQPAEELEHILGNDDLAFLCRKQLAQDVNSS